MNFHSRFICKLLSLLRKLIEKEFENKTALKIKEQECINLLKPSLNSRDAYQTEEELIAQQKAHSAKKGATKIDCICGGKTDKANKGNHEKKQIHHKDSIKPKMRRLLPYSKNGYYCYICKNAMYICVKLIKS